MTTFDASLAPSLVPGSYQRIATLTSPQRRPDWKTDVIVRRPVVLGSLLSDSDSDSRQEAGLHETLGFCPAAQTGNDRTAGPR
jgi:hypothetical protein